MAAIFVATIPGRISMSTPSWKDEYVLQLEKEVERLRSFVAMQECNCRYYGDGDWTLCHRCFVLGIEREN